MSAVLVSGCLLVARAAIGVAGGSSPKASPPPAAVAVTASCPHDTVATRAGCVRGTVLGGVQAFLGIPYAAPPTGVRRWRPPEQPAAWSGVHDASQFGKACPQDTQPRGTTTVTTDEDCLTVNVWAPHTARPPRAVMVWIHGGGFTRGASSFPVYDGSQLAGDGDVVVVSLNYRLGALGFLSHPALSAEDSQHASGNYGLLDQVAALRWVAANISAFGGDPGNVTIFGESAGGESVCALMATPLAHGLFARAIIESAQCVGDKVVPPLRNAPHGESGEQQGLRVAAQLGCPGSGADAASCLRGKSAADIIQTTPGQLGFLGKGERYGLVIDGTTLTDSPGEMLTAGKLARVPVLLGTNSDEGTLFTAAAHMQGLTPFAYAAAVAKVFPGHAREVLAHYRPAAYRDSGAALAALITDYVFTCPARATARALQRFQSHVYRYRFSHVTQASASRHLGASHGDEIAFVFGTSPSPTDAERELSRTMRRYWSQFARTGEPSNEDAWPAYDPAQDPYLELDTAIEPHDGLSTATCDFLDAVAP
jgi:para-nitrobenzyl esterase